MASRLSETSMKQTFDAGQTHLAWELPTSQSNLLDIDLASLARSSDFEVIVRSLPAQVLFHALKTSPGTEEVGLVLAAMTNDQLVRFIDYEAWDGDSLQTARAAKWLKSLDGLAPTKLAERFQHLDEEYQISMLQGHVRVFLVEDEDDVPDYILNTYTPLQDRSLYYLIDTDDQEIGEFLSQLIRSMEQYHGRYAGSLLAHAAFMPPNESEATIARMREARLEEDGFVTFHESLTAFQTIDVDRFRSKWGMATRSSSSEQAVMTTGSVFLDRVLENAEGISIEEGLDLQQRFMTLANYLCTSVRIEPNQIQELNRMFEQMRSLISLGLEYVARGDVEVARRVLVSESPKDLFRCGVSLVRKIQVKALSQIEAVDASLASSWRELLSQQKHGELLWQLDRDAVGLFGLEASEILKALLSRFPMRVCSQDGKTLKFKPVANLSDLHDLRCSIEGLHIDALQKH